MIARVPARWAEARQGLVPIVRPVSGPISLWRALRLSDPPEPTLRTLVAEGLHGLAAWDAPGVRVYVRARHLEGWGVGWPEAWAAACANLDPAAGLAPIEGGYELRAADGLAASRLALPGFLQAFAGRVGGTPIAAAPTQRALVVIGEGAAGRAAIQRAAIRAFCAEGEPVSPRLYRAGSGGAIVPAGDGGAMTEDGWAERIFRGHLYREAGELWAEAGEQVASYGAMRRRDGRAVSFARVDEALFEEGGLIPVAEAVILPGDRAAAWADLAACAAGWLEAVEEPTGGPGWVRVRPGCPGWAALEGRAARGA